MKNKILALAVAMHIAIGGYFILRWFVRLPLKVSLATRHMRCEDRIFTLGMNEYRLIRHIRANLPEDAHFVWMQEVSGVVNYYIYPRRIFWRNPLVPGEPVEFDREFLTRRRAGYVFVDYGKLYRIPL
ncbi:MAG: hypothetical protein MJA29_01480 [Candidatus Omnitrophica bacterium]|nr:hypothetical protein [Candidatus Omnitrophota bacterium]